MAVYTSTSRYYLTNNNREADRKEVSPVSYSQHVAREGDTFEKLASSIFNDGTRYWEIADLNPQVEFPDVIPAGTVLRLPR